jgi:hypothetical protein
MGILERLFGRKSAEPPAESSGNCPHAALVPKWDNHDELGKTDKVSRYVCESCSEIISPEDADRVIAAAAERLRVVTMETPTTDD